MAEDKILIPEYKRTASCERCGADVYTPDMENRGDWPLMSACSCAEGPQLRARNGTEDLKQGREQKPVEQAQAA